MTRTRTLGIALRFWPHPDADDWKRALDAIWARETSLRPQTYLITLGPEPTDRDDEPWTDEQLAQLAAACAGEDALAWTLAGEDYHLVRVTGRDGWIAIDVDLPVDAAPTPEDWVARYDAFPAALRPALVLGFDGAQDFELAKQGLRGIRRLPPILGLDPHATAALASRASLATAPCQALALGGDGLLLVANADVFDHGPAASARIRDVAEHLHISEAAPIVVHRLERRLGLVLAWHASASPDDWRGTLEAIWGWDPALRPTAIAYARHDLAVPETVREAWSAARVEELVAALADPSGDLSWHMYGEHEDAVVSCVAFDGVVELSIGARATSPIDQLLALLDRLPARMTPALVRGADFHALAELGPDTVPPLLYLGPALIERLGRARVSSAPCDVREGPAGGVLLVVRDDPFSALDEAAARAVADHLGISEDAPLVP